MEFGLIFGMQPPKPLDVASDNDNNMKTSWTLWKQQFEFYALATNLSEQPMSRQVAVFMTCIGVEALKIYNTFTLTAEQKSHLEYVKAAFEAKFIPTINVRFERFKLNKTIQSEYRNFKDFYTALRLQIKKCGYYGALNNDDLLVDRIVFGVYDDELRAKLLDVENLNLDKAVQMCMMEAEQCSKKCRVPMRREKDIAEVVEKENDIFTRKRNCNVINKTRTYVKSNTTVKFDSSSRYKALHDEEREITAFNMNHYNACMSVRNSGKMSKSRLRKKDTKDICDLEYENIESNPDLRVREISHRGKNGSHSKEFELNDENVKFKSAIGEQCNAMAKSLVSKYFVSYTIYFEIYCR